MPQTAPPDRHSARSIAHPGAPSPPAGGGQTSLAANGISRVPKPLRPVHRAPGATPRQAAPPALSLPHDHPPAARTIRPPHRRPASWRGGAWHGPRAIRTGHPRPGAPAGANPASPARPLAQSVRPALRIDPSGTPPPPTHRPETPPHHRPGARLSRAGFRPEPAFHIPVSMRISSPPVRGGVSGRLRPANGVSAPPDRRRKRGWR